MKILMVKIIKNNSVHCFVAFFFMISGFIVNAYRLMSVRHGRSFISNSVDYNIVVIILTILSLSDIFRHLFSPQIWDDFGTIFYQIWPYFTIFKNIVKRKDIA